MKKIVILGATSAIAQSVARNFAADGASLLLVGRDEQRLTAVAGDIVARGASEVQTYVCDLADHGNHEALFQAVPQKLPCFDTILIAYGTLGDQEKSQASFDVFKKEFDTNFLSVVSILEHFARVFEESGAGTLAVISSVAGDRGRKSNYAYGTAKGALSLYLQGLRNRLFSSGVDVITIKPGFVDTPMTAHIEKGPLFASSESVGRNIYQAMKKKRNVAYVPWFWRYIMTIIKLIPECIFKRLSI